MALLLRLLHFQYLVFCNTTRPSQVSDNSPYEHFPPRTLTYPRHFPSSTQHTEASQRLIVKSAIWHRIHRLTETRMHTSMFPILTSLSPRPRCARMRCQPSSAAM